MSERVRKGKSSSSESKLPRAASFRQELESVRPLVLAQPGDAPQHAQRLQRARRNDAAAIEGLPTEAPDHAFHLMLGGRVVAAKEHRGRPLLVSRMNHARRAHAVECLRSEEHTSELQSLRHL